MACISKTARRKRSEIWDSAILVMHIWGIFDLVVFKPFWGHSVQNGLYLKMAGRRAKPTAIWDSGVLITHISGIFDLVGFKVILGSFGALVSKCPVS